MTIHKLTMLQNMCAICKMVGADTSSGSVSVSMSNTGALDVSGDLSLSTVVVTVNISGDMSLGSGSSVTGLGGRIAILVGSGNGGVGTFNIATGDSSEDAGELRQSLLVCQQPVAAEP